MMGKDTVVLKALIGKGGQRINIRGLSKELKMDYKNVHGIVSRLCKEGVVSFEKFGNSKECRINKSTNPLIYQAENERKEALLKNSNIKAVHDKLRKLPFSLIALIFGSHAKGTASKGSDIDLMIVCEKSREKEIESTLSLLPLKIHLVTFSYSDFLSMTKSKEFSVVSEVLKSNVILIGIEDYYRLIQNVE